MSNDLEQVKRAIAIIPARKGSKRLPGKNMIPLVGKPLIAYTVEAALKSNSLGLICASSDDDELLKFLNKEYGIMMIRRPPKFARDDSPIQEAVHHAVGVLELARIDFDIVVLLQANVVLRIPEQIDTCVNLLRNDETLDSAVTVKETYYPYHTYLVKENKLVYPWDKRKPFISLVKQVFRKQDQEQFYEVDGAVQAIRRSSLEKTKSVKGLHPYLGLNTATVVSPPWRNLEVDTPEDLKIAEVLLHGL
jgi:CMP-N-acetylneuraminic acid synthetase